VGLLGISRSEKRCLLCLGAVLEIFSKLHVRFTRTRQVAAQQLSRAAMYCILVGLFQIITKQIVTGVIWLGECFPTSGRQFPIIASTPVTIYIPLHYHATRHTWIQTVDATIHYSFILLLYRYTMQRVEYMYNTHTKRTE